MHYGSCAKGEPFCFAVKQSAMLHLLRLWDAKRRLDKIQQDTPLQRRNKSVAICKNIVYNGFTALGGEPAVPCNSQSATVGLNVAGGNRRGKQEATRSVDTKVLCNVTLPTVSGWEHSSTTQLEACATR